MNPIILANALRYLQMELNDVNSIPNRTGVLSNTIIGSQKRLNSALDKFRKDDLVLVAAEAGHAIIQTEDRGYHLVCIEPSGSIPEYARAHRFYEDVGQAKDHLAEIVAELEAA